MFSNFSVKNFDKLDAPDIEETNFGENMKRWLANIVDICNSNFDLLNSYINNFITSQGVMIGGTGVSYNIPVIGLTSTGFVSATIISEINPAMIVTITPGLNSFNITFDIDPGAGSIIVYQAFISEPQ
jgi:hypothetical protein